jgi:MFS superfamily sulfate permease-like transporter
MIGIGAANLAAGLFQGFPVSTQRVAEPAAARAGRRGDHRLAVAGRHPRHGAVVAAAQGRVPAVDRGTTASGMLEELDEALNAQQTSLVFAELKDAVRGKIERYGLTRTIDRGTSTRPLPPVRPLLASRPTSPQRRP